MRAQLYVYRNFELGILCVYTVAISENTRRPWRGTAGEHTWEPTSGANS